MSVADTGSGIAKEDISKLFTRFYSHNSGSSKTGIGLGLNICRYLVEEYSGNMTVENTLGPNKRYKTTANELLKVCAKNFR